MLLFGCASMPKPKHDNYRFPKEAFVETPKRPYSVIGTVRSKVNFTSLDVNRDENELCKNYYNKAVADLIRIARSKQADAVIDVKSVVFLEDGRVEMYKTPECSDDGGEGQILAQGIAVKWKPIPTQETADPFSIPSGQTPTQAPKLVQPSPRPSAGAPR